MREALLFTADITDGAPRFNHELAPFASVWALSHRAVAQMTRFGRLGKGSINCRPQGGPDRPKKSAASGLISAW
jgi:hypothetical protein